MENWSFRSFHFPPLCDGAEIRCYWFTAFTTASIHSWVILIHSKTRNILIKKPGNILVKSSIESSGEGGGSVCIEVGCVVTRVFSAWGNFSTSFHSVPLRAFCKHWASKTTEGRRNSEKEKGEVKVSAVGRCATGGLVLAPYPPVLRVAFHSFASCRLRRHSKLLLSLFLAGRLAIMVIIISF